ncbi:DUF881 domain-containing protein [Mycolicibacillus parakoreensis]|uniref:DUF881 domain-containing protein n=2 Tax=Mycobacteriaceae TaxID=1762 RepID=A0ABY3U421_9MYCO|nr:DUF881 domain-containing protein [Mycolicibacillus parakoreensis]MCV7316630.1 DUF881 domain-containing protein [Mycolicibacillus parakoreensis]ULN52841.1 DUF881 domain-containing protein [Mycolicibacillus parakoreensis]HLR98380.1 DUF881 domain-containing protein [Mycolicibacillus parakoreensis]
MVDTAPVRRHRLWSAGVPVVCLAAGLLLAATHGVSGGDEIRSSDAPRLVDMVNAAQQHVDELAARRDTLTDQIDSVHGASADTALAAMLARASTLSAQAGLDPVRGPGLVVTLTDAQRDADGRFPRDASPDDLVVHQQDIQGVLNALWSAGAEAIQVQDQRVIATSAVRCVGNTLLLNGRTYSPPYTVSALGDAEAMQAALAEEPRVVLYRQYVVRFGLGYSEEVRPEVEIAGHTQPLRLRYAQPSGPVGY